MRVAQARTVHVDPMKPKLKAPGSTHLKLKCDELLSNSAFNINLRCYSEARTDAELRTLVMRGSAGLETSTRSPGGAARNWCQPAAQEFTVERAALPPADYDNVANRLGAASAAVIDGAFGVASEAGAYTRPVFGST